MKLYYPTYVDVDVAIEEIGSSFPKIPVGFMEYLLICG